MTKSNWRAAAALSLSLAASPAMAITALLDLEFDEGTGTTAVNAGDLGTGSNGSISGATYSADSAFSTGFSLLFDGDTDFVEIPDTFDYGASVSLEAWIKPDAVDGQRAIYDDYGNPGVFLSITGGKLQWNLSTAAHPGQGRSIVNGVICGGVWQHVAGTYDGATMRAFVNGIEVGNAATSGNIADNSGLATHIGADSATPNLLEFSGRIDALRLFSETLTFGNGSGESGAYLICGELTGDCRISTTDALAALRMAVGLRAVDGAADIDYSGEIVTNDALRILRLAVLLDAQTNACNGL